MGIKYSYSSSIISLYELFQAPLFIFYRVSFLVWSLSRIHSRVRSTSRCAVRFPAHSLAPILESILILSQGMRIGGCAKKDQSETSQSPAFNRFLHGGRFRGIYTGVTSSKTSGRIFREDLKTHCGLPFWLIWLDGLMKLKYLRY